MFYARTKLLIYTENTLYIYIYIRKTFKNK